MINGTKNMRIIMYLALFIHSSQTLKLKSLADPIVDEALMEYSELVANGQNVNVLDAKLLETQQTKQNQEEMTHAEETPNVVEYSMTLAGNTLEKAQKQENDDENENSESDKEQNQENVQITASPTQWYENDKKDNTIDYNSLDKKQKLELSHKAMIQGQKDLQSGKPDEIEEKAQPSSEQTDEIEMTAEQLINLKSQSSVQRSQWPQDVDTTEINTDAWDQTRLADGSADSPFQTIKYSSDAKLSKDEIADKNTDEIVDFYNKKYEGPKSKNEQKPKPSFFEELWAKQHPEEKALIQQENDKEASLDKEYKEATATEDTEAAPPKSNEKSDTIAEQPKPQEKEVAAPAPKTDEKEKKTKAIQKTAVIKQTESSAKDNKQHLSQQNEKSDSQAPFFTETQGETKFDIPKHNEYGLSYNEGDKAPLTAEEEYQKLISDAKNEDPWKEPIKDLIDSYADLAEKTEKEHKTEKEKTVENLFKQENKNNYGNSKPKVVAEKTKAVQKAKSGKKAEAPKQKIAQQETEEKNNGNISKLVAAMEKTAKKEYEAQEKKAKVETPKEEEALTPDQGEAIAKSMLDDYLEEQKPKPVPQKVKKAAAAPHKKVVQVKKQPKKQRYDPKVKAQQKLVLAEKLSQKKTETEAAPTESEFENENPQNNQFALITLLASKINVPVTPAILELQGADQIDRLTSTLINTAIENGTDESVIEKAVDELHQALGA